jgi:hypothetical protein
MKTSEFFKTLKSHNLSHLEKDTGVSRQALHNAIKTHNMKLDNLSTVAKSLHLKVEFTPVTNEENLMSSLAKLGAPLAHSKDGNLTLDECVGETLKRTRHDGVYETLLPYVLALNVEKLNPLKLAASAFTENQVNVLGYFVDLANQFRPHEKFQYLLKLLEPAKSDEKEFLVLNTKSHFPELFKKNKLALKWNLKVRGTVTDHLQRWAKWEKSHKHS